MNVPQDRKLSVIMLLVYLLASCVAAIVGAHFTALATITEFYAALAKPVWAPPGWLFAPVWTLLYVCMSVAVWLVWKNRSNRPVRAYSMALVCWWVQLGLNAAWPVVFWLYPAGFAPFFACGALAVVVWACVAVMSRISVIGGMLMVPYACWVCFATALSWALWRMNAPL